MTHETAKILTTALNLRDEAANALRLERETPGIKEERIRLADIYVHEQRIINRIVSEARDA